MKIGSISINRTLIYPGSFIIKRLIHIAILFFVGINIFFNQLQDIVLDKIEKSSKSVLEIVSNAKIDFKYGRNQKMLINAIKIILPFNVLSYIILKHHAL